MPLLLRRSAPSPSVDELAFTLPAGPAEVARSVSAAEHRQMKRCSTHRRLSMRRRRSTAGTEGELSVCSEERCNDPAHRHVPPQLRASQPNLQRCSGLDKSKGVDPDLAAALRDSKQSSRDTLPEDVRSENGCTSEAGRPSSVLSCGCSVVDASEMALTSSTVVIEDRQLAVLDRELRDFRKTLIRKFCSRFKISSAFSRKRSATRPPMNR